MSGHVGVVYGRVAVGQKSCTAVGRAWSGNVGNRDDRVDLIGSETYHYMYDQSLVGPAGVQLLDFCCSSVSELVCC